MATLHERPSDVPHNCSLAWVAHHYTQCLLTLFEYRQGGAILTPECAGRAVGALAYGAALIERVESGRWPIVADALVAGVGLERTAESMGLDVWDVRIGLGQWAAEQHRLGVIDAERYEQIVSLIR